MRKAYYILLVQVLILSGCKTGDTHDGLIGWEISFGINGSNIDYTPGMTSDQLDSVCNIIATENGYRVIGSNHILLHKVADRNDLKTKTMDFAWCVDERVKALWGKDVQVDSRYSKLQIIFDADFDTQTEIVAIYRYK